MASATAAKYRELREARGWSTAELARRTDTDEAMVRRWESGDEEPTPEHLFRLAGAFGVSQDELRHEEDERHHPRQP